MIIVNEIRHIKNITFLMDFYVVKINNFIKVIQHLLFLEKQRDKYVYYITRTNKNKNKNKKVKNVNTTTNSNEKNNEKNDKNNENNDKNNDNVTDDHCGHHECDDLEGRHKIQQILYNIKNMKKKRIKKNVLLDFYTQILTIHRRDQPNLINYYVTLINKLKTFKYNIQLKKIFIQNVIKEINKEYNSFLIDLHYMYFKVKKEVFNINNYDNNNEGHEIPSIAFNTSHNKHIYVYKSIGHVYKNILKTLKLRLEVFLNYIYNLCNNIYKKINIYMANVFSMFIDTQEGLFSLMSKRKEYLKEIIKIISAQDNSEHVKNRISCDTLLNTFNNNDIEEDGFEKYNLKNNQNMNNDEYTNHYMSQKKYTFTKLNYITSFYENNYYGHENNNVRRDSNYFQNEQENINESGHINNVEDNINGKKKEQEDQNKDNNNENNNNDNENNNNDNENNNNDNNNDNNDNNVVKPRMKKEVITIKNIIMFFKRFKGYFKLCRKNMYELSPSLMIKEGEVLHELVVRLLNHYTSIININKFFYKSFKKNIYNFNLPVQENKMIYILKEIYLLLHFHITHIWITIKEHTEELKNIKNKITQENNFFDIFISYVIKNLGTGDMTPELFEKIKNVEKKITNGKESSRSISLYKWRSLIKINTEIDLKHGGEVSILQILSFPYDEFFNELIEENYNEENIFKKSSLEMYKIYSKYCYSTNRKEVKECVGVHLNRTCLYQENNFIHKVLQFLQAKKCSHICMLSIEQNNILTSSNILVNIFNKKNERDKQFAFNLIVHYFIREKGKDTCEIHDTDKNITQTKNQHMHDQVSYDNSAIPILDIQKIISEKNESEDEIKSMHSLLNDDKTKNMDDNQEHKENSILFKDDISNQEIKLSDEESTFEDMNIEVLNMIKKIYEEREKKKLEHIHNKQNTPSVQDTHNNDSKSIMSPDFNNDTNKKRETHINNNIPNPNDGRNEDKTTILDEKRKLEESQNEEKNKCPILEIDDHIFEINDKDHLNYIMRSSMNTFNCALSKKILIQGKIFITMDGIYFISLFNSLFSKNTILKIKYVDIVSVEKLTILHFLANSIKIITKYKSFVFTSFVHRNHCYNLIMDMIYENNNTHIIPKKGTVIIDRYHEYDTDEKNDLSDEVDNTNDINYHIKEGIHTNDKIYKGDIINDYKNNHIIDHYLKDNEMLTDSSKIKNDFPTNIENNKTKNNITNGKCPILHVSNYTKDNNLIYVETINKHLPLNIDTEENEILKNNNFINCTNYIDSLFINRNFKDIFLDIYSNLQNQYNPLLKSVLDKKPLNLSYEHIKDIKDLMYNKTFLTYTTEYNILLFNNETKLIGLPDRSNVKEIFMFFFFKNNIIIQKIITLLSNIPLAGSFNTIVTLNIHNVMNQNTNNYYTQIDFSYDIEFVKSTFFKNHIKNNALPRLEKSIKDLKDYTKEAILQIYQNYDNQTINNNHVNPHQQNNMNQKNKSQKYQSFTFKNNIHIAKTDLQHMTINELREYFKHDFKSVDHLSSYTPRNHVLFNSIHYGICNLQIT
ncbi:hypothetical protein PFUGPA_05644 [Plasmodium falciparum Palo Alto/Uganda]|uniref:GRAM domain-containing protein n=1 Tax=Plasmodium falciparum (isolate Palo Alto / Uganda) TaxID=57270 RepID=W4IRN4_PLAFP|nr:hypothetical protein PFUGPA_05644 [Plasmodium falciparum Palo Alto/Uganda]